MNRNMIIYIDDEDVYERIKKMLFLKQGETELKEYLDLEYRRKQNAT